MEQFRPVLVIFAGPSNVYDGRMRVTSDVQVWRGDICVTTVQMLDIAGEDWPPEFDPSCVEQFAGITSRIVARQLDEKLYERLAAGKVNKWSDLHRQFPPPTGVRK